MSNEQLVELVQSQIREARRKPIGEEEDFTISTKPTDIEQAALPLDLEEQDFALPDRAIIPMEELDVSDDGMFVKEIKRKGEQDRQPWSPPPYVPQESLGDRAKRLMREDLENAGPVSETIKRNQLSGAQMAMFAASDSEVWRAAFDELNPISALARLINDQLYDIDDDPDYDFAAPKDCLKARPLVEVL